MQELTIYNYQVVLALYPYHLLACYIERTAPLWTQAGTHSLFVTERGTSAVNQLPHVASQPSVPLSTDLV